ncbi:NAD(P)/FAD-dependent oxidoreductase [uncultured Corynebacterium sp.]|uniref:dihydrolipoyl dehydrogenase family protein n=1 Tax=uncultured Corynebacterium sp. TaxID=159447 RepID=UPI0025E817E6|nr:FAD-dependent oxidoreductase [uncultured Corynebacterium sp.]
MSDTATAAPSSTLSLDVLVVGFGKAGKTIAMTRAKAGDRVAIVEKSPAMYGGTCINIACVPTKTLLVSAERHARSLDDGIGLPSADADVDAGAVLSGAHDSAFVGARDHRDGFIAKLNAANEKMARTAGVMIIDGTARFTGPRTVEVTGGDDVLSVSAETVIVNVGSVPVMPPIDGIDGPRVTDSTGIQALPERPAALTIVGGGPIGLEFATMFAKFGTKVTVLDGADEFLGRYDRDVADAVRDNLVGQGIDIVSGARATAFDDDGESVTTTYTVGDEEKKVRGDRVLVAVGRRPATDDLGLESAGIEVTDRGAIVVDEHLRTGVDGVYAVGDVNGGPQFTYVSYDDHRVVMSDRWGDGSRTTTDRVIPTTTFIDPPLSTIGAGEDAAREDVEGRGHTLDVRVSAVADLAIVPRPKILGRPEGMVKFLVDREADRIVGASLFCVDSQELINTVAVAIANDLPASAVGGGIYTHPSTSEVFNAMLA